MGGFFCVKNKFAKTIDFNLCLRWNLSGMPNI